MTLVYIAQFIPLVPALFAMLKWRSMQTHQRWFAVLLWSIVVISFSGEIYRVWGEELRNNMPFFHTYILAEFLILMQVFRHMLNKSVAKKVWWLLSLGFIVCWIVILLTGEGWWGFPSSIHAIEAIIVLVLVILWFLKMLREKTVARPAKTFEFWMCAGLLIYFTGNFLLFLFPKFIIDAGAEVFRAIWKMNCILIILLYLSYTIALLWVKKKVN
jgi:hypothetical protein